MQAASGSRDAQTVYRSKETGARMSKEEFEAANKKASEKKKAVYEAPEWGGGMRQVSQAFTMRLAFRGMMRLFG